MSTPTLGHGEYPWGRPSTLERAKGFEPSTPTLARLCSTPELHPHPRRQWPLSAALLCQMGERKATDSASSGVAALWDFRPCRTYWEKKNSLQLSISLPRPAPVVKGYFSTPAAGRFVRFRSGVGVHFGHSSIGLRLPAYRRCKVPRFARSTTSDNLDKSRPQDPPSRRRAGLRGRGDVKDGPLDA
jgi:hypothetical protein